jgi:Glutathione S-transferase, N-terminal domain
MVRPLKLYHHSQAPNPRRVRIFAAEKGIELALEEIDILAGQGRTPEFLAKNSSGAVPGAGARRRFASLRASSNLPVPRGASS